jgi:hypothetical protein
LEEEIGGDNGGVKKRELNGGLEFVAWALHLLLALPLKLPIVYGNVPSEKSSLFDIKYRVLWLDLAPLLRPVLNIVMCLSSRYPLYKVC